MFKSRWHERADFWHELAEKNALQASAYCGFYMAVHQALRERPVGEVMQAVQEAEDELTRTLGTPVFIREL